MPVQPPVSLGCRSQRDGGADQALEVLRRGVAWSLYGDMVNVCSQGRVQYFCEWYRFVCSFIAHLPPFLPTLIFLVRFYIYSLYTCLSSPVYFPFFERFLILLLLQYNVTTPQTRCLIVDE